MKQNIDVSVIVVSYNTKDLLIDCLHAVEEARKKGQWNVEIIVVDNNSTDGTDGIVQKTYPDIDFYKLKENRGFAGANNYGIQKSNGTYVLLLNSDVVVSPDVFSTMIPFMEKNPNIGVSTCKLVLSDGSLDPACHRGFPTPWASCTYYAHLEKLFPTSKLFASYHLGYLSKDSIHDIDSPSGAFYLVRRKVIDEVGLLDEDYFMYAEDLDWSYRIKQKGWRIVYAPLTRAMHHKKQSGRSSANRESSVLATSSFYDTMKIFYRKHYIKRYPSFFMNILFIIIDRMKERSLQKIDQP